MSKKSKTRVAGISRVQMVIAFCYLGTSFFAAAATGVVDQINSSIGADSVMYSLVQNRVGGAAVSGGGVANDSSIRQSDGAVSVDLPVPAVASQQRTQPTLREISINIWQDERSHLFLYQRTHRCLVGGVMHFFHIPKSIMKSRNM